MKRGESDSRTLLISLAIGAVILFVVIFSLFGFDFLGKTRSLFGGLNNTQQPANLDYALGYNLREGTSAYYTGNEWVKIKEDFMLNEKKFSKDDVDKAFLGFYFSPREAETVALSYKIGREAIFGKDSNEISNSLEIVILGIQQNSDVPKAISPVIFGTIRNSSILCYGVFYIDSRQDAFFYKIKSPQPNCLGEQQIIKNINKDDPEIRKIIDESVKWRDSILKGGSGERQIEIAYRDKSDEEMLFVGYVEKLDPYIFTRLEG